ncbi:uncharacterized protein LOC109851243 [Asparagus officinalis]|uniref:uncharacterized protein LOC109851243 n=1 Tax=Asparagus officinalis TaxID=4686 RepID=UPI00098E426B|nr:uncharacterized protein LOC109851243 [Asparagus officinalis]
MQRHFVPEFDFKENEEPLTFDSPPPSPQKHADHADEGSIMELAWHQGPVIGPLHADPFLTQRTCVRRAERAKGATFNGGGRDGHVATQHDQVEERGEIILEQSSKGVVVVRRLRRELRCRGGCRCCCLSAAAAATAAATSTEFDAVGKAFDTIWSPARDSGGRGAHASEGKRKARTGRDPGCHQELDKSCSEEREHNNLKQCSRFELKRSPSHLDSSLSILYPRTQEDSWRFDQLHPIEISYKSHQFCEVPLQGVRVEHGNKKKEVLTSRTRAAEVHNLSERRRRDKINEKMKALQELIPRCNKSDKASMLDDAIEYLKSLQLQVQMLSSMQYNMGHMMFPDMQRYMQTLGFMGMSMAMASGGIQRPMMSFAPILPYPPVIATPPPNPQPRPVPSFHLANAVIPDQVRTEASNQQDAASNSINLMNPNMVQDHILAKSGKIKG